MRARVQAGSRWAHRSTDRVAIVTRVVNQHVVEYKYARPTRYHVYMTTIPYTRRTRMSYCRFVTDFRRKR